MPHPDALLAMDAPPPPWRAELAAALRTQLQNSIVGGSVALFVASALLRGCWQAAAALRAAVEDALFTRYDFPLCSPQAIAAARFLQSQPAMARASRRVVMDRRAARCSALVNARGAQRRCARRSREGGGCVGWLRCRWHCSAALRLLFRRRLTLCFPSLRVAAQAQSLRAVSDEVRPFCEGCDEDGSPRFVAVPTLAAGRGTLLLWRRRLIWARAGAEARDPTVASYIGQQPWSPFAALQSFDSIDESYSSTVASAGAAAVGASPAGSISLLVLRTPLGRDSRGEAAVAALLEEGERLALRGAGGVRFTQVFFSRCCDPSAAHASSSQRPVAAARFCWAPAGSRPSRSIDSVILPGDAAAELLADARAFAGAEAWYAARGVPYRRGYLLHGAPGSGKTSLVTAIAGELGLPVYCLSLSAPGLDDAALQTLLAATVVAQRAVLVLEDVDAAFTPLHATSRAGEHGMSTGSLLSYSGLLNSLDGLVASEGRLLFLTANDESRLPPALVRPGRVDRRMRFDAATQEQAARHFGRFYDDDDVAEMAASFAAALPAERFTMANAPMHRSASSALRLTRIRSVPENGLSAAEASAAAAARPLRRWAVRLLRRAGRLRALCVPCAHARRARAPEARKPCDRACPASCDARHA